MCVGLSWVPIAKKNQFDKYLNIRNMPECEESKNGRSQWEPDYPTHGNDFNIRKQETKKGDKELQDSNPTSESDTKNQLDEEQTDSSNEDEEPQESHDSNNQKLEITGLDFDTIKDNLKTYMKNQKQFLDYDFEGSGINALLDVLAYNTHYLGFHANMLANEMFIDSAQLRSSVVSHAKTLGYVPRSVRAPKANVNVTLNDRALATATMNAGQVFTTTIDNVEYQFVTVADFSATQTGTNLVFSDIPIYEGTYVTTRYTVATSDVNQRFQITSNQADTTTLSVQVQNSSSDSTTETYNLATDITQLTGSSVVYFLQEVEDGLFEVYFGDGVVSKAVSDGNIVILKYVVTNIAEANGAFSFTNSGAIDTVTDVTTTTMAAASGGAAAESTQSIKLSAPLDYASQGRCVTTNDYKVYVQKFYPQATAVQIFGGENGSFDSSLGVVSTPDYGKVFISVRNNLGTNLTTDEKAT